MMIDFFLKHAKKILVFVYIVSVLEWELVE